MNGVSSSENNEMFGVTNYGIDSFGSWLIIHQLSRSNMYLYKGTLCTSHCIYLWPLLLTWFNFNPSMDK